MRLTHCGATTCSAWAAIGFNGDWNYKCAEEKYGCAQNEEYMFHGVFSPGTANLDGDSFHGRVDYHERVGKPLIFRNL